MSAPQRPVAPADRPRTAPRADAPRVPHSPQLDQVLALLDPAAREALLDIVAEERAAREGLPAAEARNRQLRHRLEAAGLSPEPTLDELADRGEVRFSLNDTLTGHEPVSAETAAEFGLSPEQVGAIDTINRDSGGALRSELRDLYAELGGDPEASADFTLGALVDAIRDATPPEEFEAAVRAVSGEQAGRTAAADDPAADSVAARMLRALLAREARVQDQLAALLGDELAAALLAGSDVGGVDMSVRVGARQGE